MPVQEQIDRVAIAELVQRERIARDMWQWEELAACYNADSRVDISWFTGSGAEFAAASAKMAVGGLRTFHQMSPTVTQIRGNRALADTGCAVHLLSDVDGVDVVVISHARLRSRVERKTSEWLLSGLRVVYVQDMMIPLDPSQRPRLDPAKLTGYRASYRFMCFLLSQRGYAPKNSLPGTDRPDTVTTLLDAEVAWLHGQG